MKTVIILTDWVCLHIKRVYLFQIMKRGNQLPCIAWCFTSVALFNHDRAFFALLMW